MLFVKYYNYIKVNAANDPYNTQLIKKIKEIKK